jgi:DNA-binding YbaB/EbfC family protein
MAKGGGMPRGGGGGGDIMKQIQQMQSKLAETQAKLEEMEFEASSGGGAVHVVVNAHPQVRTIEIKPEVVDPDDVEMLQDLIQAAMNDALEKVRQGQMQQLAGLAGGLNIPELNLGG